MQDPPVERLRTIIVDNNAATAPNAPVSAAQYRAHVGPRAERRSTVMPTPPQVPARPAKDVPTLEPVQEDPSQPRISYVHQMETALTEAHRQREGTLLRNRELLVELANLQGEIRERELELRAARQQTAVRPPPPPARSNQLDARFVARWIIGAVVCGFSMCTAMTAFVVWALRVAGH